VFFRHVVGGLQIKLYRAALFSGPGHELMSSLLIAGRGVRHYAHCMLICTSFAKNIAANL